MVVEDREWRILREESHVALVQQLKEAVGEGFRAAHDMWAFADWDEDEKAWKTLFVIALCKDKEAEGSAHVPLAARRMFL